MTQLDIAVIPGDGIGKEVIPEGMQVLKYPKLHDGIVRAMETVLREGGCLTRDMGGTAGTRDLGRGVAEALG